MSTLKGSIALRPQTDDRPTLAARGLDMNDPADRDYVRQSVALTMTSSTRGWKWYENIPEVHYALSRAERIAGYARLFARRRISRQGEPPRYVEASGSGNSADVLARRIVESIYSPHGGVRGLVERYYTLMKVPAEAYLIRDAKYGGYMFLSPDEVDASELRKDGGFLIWRTSRNAGRSSSTRDELGAFQRKIPYTDFIGRVWMPSRRFIDDCDSPMSALDTECEVLYTMTLIMKGRLRSRFSTSGIWLIPNSIREANVQRLDGKATRENVLDYLAKAVSTNIAKYEDAQIAQPIFLMMEGNDTENFRIVRDDPELTEIDISLRQSLIERVLDGLDVSKKSTQGMEGVSHFGAWQQSDEERRIAVTPDLETMVWALNSLILQVELDALGVSPETAAEYDIWFDLSEASVRANQNEDVRQAWDRGEAGGRAMRRVSGLPDDDAMTEEERVRWLGQKSGNAWLGTYGLEIHDKIDWDEAAKHNGKANGPKPASNADDPGAGPGNGDPGSPDDSDTDTPRTQRPA